MWPPQDLAPISLSTQPLLRLRRHKAAIGYAVLRHGGVIGGERRLPPCKCKAHGSLGRTRVPGGQSRASCRKLCHTPRRGLTRRSFSNSISQRAQRGRVPGVAIHSDGATSDGTEMSAFVLGQRSADATGASRIQNINMLLELKPSNDKTAETRAGDFREARAKTAELCDKAGMAHAELIADL